MVKSIKARWKWIRQIWAYVLLFIFTHPNQSTLPNSRFRQYTAYHHFHLQVSQTRPRLSHYFHITPQLDHTSFRAWKHYLANGHARNLQITLTSLFSISQTRSVPTHSVYLQSENYNTIQWVGIRGRGRPSIILVEAEHLSSVLWFPSWAYFTCNHYS